MNNFKVAFLEELENKAQSKFKIDSNISICVLPPILKKINLRLYMFFLVVEKPNPSNNYTFKNPIGIIKTYTNSDKVLEIYDLTKFDFCNCKIDFSTYKKNNLTNFQPQNFPRLTSRNADSPLMISMPHPT